MVLECAKDSSFSSLASGTVKWTTKKQRGMIVTTYTDQELDVNE
jgi:hypothetical protein